MGDIAINFHPLNTNFTSSHLLRYITSSDKTLEMSLLAMVIFTFVVSFVGSQPSPLPGPVPAPMPAWKLIETDDSATIQEPDNDEIFQMFPSGNDYGKKEEK